MYHLKTPRATNAPNSHPGRVRNTPSDNPQLSPILNEWHGHELISLLPQDIFLADPNTNVRHSRIPTQRLGFQVACTSLPDQEDERFAHFSCELPPATSELQQDAVYVVSEETLSHLLLSCYLHHTALPFRVAVPTNPVRNVGGAILGYETLTILDQPAPTPQKGA